MYVFSVCVFPKATAGPDFASMASLPLYTLQK